MGLPAYVHHARPRMPRTWRLDELTYRISRVLAYLLLTYIPKNAVHTPIRTSRAKIISGHAGGLISSLDLDATDIGPGGMLKLTPTRSPHAHPGTRLTACPKRKRGRYDLNTACSSEYAPPFFQRDKAVEASFRAMVSRTISRSLPSSTNTS